MLYENYLPSLLTFLRSLRPELLKLYHQDHIDTEIKTDHSPVTAADWFSHDAILNFLNTLTPDIPVLSEEALIKQDINTLYYWCVDPLDGTREFLAKTDDFSINIALIEKNIAVLGVIYAPVFDVFYFAVKNQGVFKQDGDQAAQHIHVRKLNTHKPVVIASRRHANNEKLQQFFNIFTQYERLSRGSAIKFGLIAEGIADIYPRLGATSFWDTAAGQCIVEEAGGVVVDPKGNPLRYNAIPPYENPFFIAMDKDNDFLERWRDLYDKYDKHDNETHKTR